MQLPYAYPQTTVTVTCHSESFKKNTQSCRIDTCLCILIRLYKTVR